MLKRKSSCTFLWFLMGLTEATCINLGGYIGISELVAFILAPILLIQDTKTIKKDGFSVVLWLAFMAVVGNFVACFHNNIEFGRMIRGFGNTYGLFSGIVVFHHLLRKDIHGVKYYFIGVALSALVTIFMLRGGAEDSKAMARGVEAVWNSPLFIMAHFGPLLTLPLYSFYMSSPTWLTATAFAYPSVEAIMNTATGRSAVMMTLMSLLLVLFANRKVSRMRTLKKYFPIVFGVGFLVVVVFAQGYKYAAKSGLLNEEAQKKYENQAGKVSKGGLLGMIMAGRSEFFVGLMAAIDNPVYGLGPWAADTNHYSEQFLFEYGNQEDLEFYLNRKKRAESKGYAMMLPVHSIMVSNWVYYGILGLPLWLYVLFKLLQLFRWHIDAVPQWFGYFAFTVPNNIWGIFFSPFGGRMSWAAFISLVLIAIAISKHKMELPLDMVMEAEAKDKKRGRAMRPGLGYGTR